MCAKQSEAGAPALTVSGLNREVRSRLERDWSSVRVEGECSDVTRAASGHYYFTLNDEKRPAQVRCVMFRGDAGRSPAKPENGKRIELEGGLSLYEARGSFQLIVRRVTPAGLGDLAARFEALKRKLQAEGLFEPSRKRPVPTFPRRIGIVTSRSGAALHDVVRVLEGRLPVPVLLADCRVQGEGAPAQIVAALQRLGARAELDVIILTRGGGSAEDLWSFNDEGVVRAVAACPKPVICGVGHEVDVTLADFAADVRAATPSNAAELAVPERAAVRQQLVHQERRLAQRLDALLGAQRLRLERALRRLSLPRTLLEGPRDSLRRTQKRLEFQARGRLMRERRGLAQRTETLRELDPRRRLVRYSEQLRALRQRLERLGPQLAVMRRQRLAEQLRALDRALGASLLASQRALSARAAQLEALSPLRVLGRGYAIALKERGGHALTAAKDARPGERLRLRLHEGELRVEVLSDKQAAQASLEL